MNFLSRHLPIFAIALALAGTSAPAAHAAITSLKATPDSDYTVDASRTLRAGAGQFVVRISGKRDDQSFVVTPSVVVRANNATLIVQVSARRCRIAVLSGEATVKNLAEKHIFRLEHGAAYDTLLTREAASALGADLQAKPVVFEQIVDRSTCLPAYQTSKGRTALYKISPAALKESRLGQLVDEDVLESTSDTSVPAAHIVSPPTVLSYDIGARMANCMPVPLQLFQHFPPSGVMAPQGSGELVAEGEEVAR